MNYSFMVYLTTLSMSNDVSPEYEIRVITSRFPIIRKFPVIRYTIIHNVPLHAMETFGVRGGIAPTNS
jgi:hypothetical protein